GKAGLARHGVEIGEEVGLRRRTRERAQRRQELHGGGAEVLRKLRELRRSLEGGMRDPGHDRHAGVDEVDGVANERLALLEAEIAVFLGLDSGGDHHGGATILDHVIDLAPERRPVDLEVGGERRQRRNDQSRILHPRSPWRSRRRCPRPPMRTAMSGSSLGGTAVAMGGGPWSAGPREREDRTLARCYPRAQASSRGNRRSPWVSSPFSFRPSRMIS